MFPTETEIRKLHRLLSLQSYKLLDCDSRIAGGSYFAYDLASPYKGPHDLSITIGVFPFEDSYIEFHYNHLRYYRQGTLVRKRRNLLVLSRKNPLLTFKGT